MMTIISICRAVRLAKSISIAKNRYPREFKDAASASQLRDSPYRFFRVDWGGPMFMLAKGWAVLDGPAFPILGEGDAEPNDSFVKQLVGSAAAAIDAVVDMGVADREKMAVGGHSCE